MNKMNYSTTDIGLLEALVERLEKERLPRLLDLKKIINAGESLNDFDLEYLERSIKDAVSNKPLAERHPELQTLAMEIIHLYKYISEKALENEKNNK
ncbi:hypothetical protein MNBD_GAMMA11-59 [hydrothermal vent metagenome]|uniref:Uncharacterized protein n=1 Tax=hydrothermal vent metagenome TaxID=652676 RepID=A0A3B0XVF6_9ZZZZ